MDIMKGCVIQAIPGTPLWRSGARFGEVIAVKRGKDELLARFQGFTPTWVSMSAVLEN